MSENVFTIAELKAKEGRLEELKEILTELADQTREEPGALEYIFVLDEKTPDTILSYEKWASVEDEKAHWDTPHLKAALKRFGDVLDGAPVVHKGKKII